MILMLRYVKMKAVINVCGIKGFWNVAFSKNGMKVKKLNQPSRMTLFCKSHSLESWVKQISKFSMRAWILIICSKMKAWFRNSKKEKFWAKKITIQISLLWPLWKSSQSNQTQNFQKNENLVLPQKWTPLFWPQTKFLSKICWCCQNIKNNSLLNKFKVVVWTSKKIRRKIWFAKFSNFYWKLIVSKFWFLIPISLLLINILWTQVW